MRWRTATVNPNSSAEQANEWLREHDAKWESYAKHKDSCTKYDWDTSPGNCGLDELRQPKKSPETDLDRKMRES
jgi:hypothetical protein